MSQQPEFQSPLCQALWKALNDQIFPMLKSANWLKMGPLGIVFKSMLADLPAMLRGPLTSLDSDPEKQQMLLAVVKQFIAEVEHANDSQHGQDNGVRPAGDGQDNPSQVPGEPV